MSAAFIAEGIEILQNPQPLADRLGPVLDRTRRQAQHRANDDFAVAPSSARVVEPSVSTSSETSNDSTSDHRIPAPPLPESPETLARVIGGVQIASAALLALGKAPRPAAAALAATTAVNLSQHAFWTEVDPDVKRNERTEFLSGVSKLGGLLIVASDTEGKPSLGWRGRRAANQAREQAAALAASAAALTETARERGSDLADTAKERLHLAEPTLNRRGRRAARKASERAAALAETARERGPELAEAARERATDLAETARDRGTELAETARERGPELADRLRERSSELAELARERGAELADTVRDQAPHVAEAAREKAHKAAEIARAKAEVARARAHELRAQHL